MSTNSLDTTALLVDLLKQGESVRLPVNGQSMRPFLRDGDTVIATPCHRGELRPGDIGIYLAADGKITIHRALFCDPENGTWAFRGDASRGIVESIPGKAVLGRVSMAERHGRIVYRDNYLHRWTGRIWQKSSIWRFRLTKWRRISPGSGAPRTGGE